MEKGNYTTVFEVSVNGDKLLLVNRETEEAVQTTEIGRAILTIGKWLYNR